jgi:hypothetical protein
MAEVLHEIADHRDAGTPLVSGVTLAFGALWLGRGEVPSLTRRGRNPVPTLNIRPARSPVDRSVRQRSDDR